MVLDKINLVVGTVGGGAVAASVTLLWTFVIHDPQVREQTRTIVTAELEANFNKAVGELTNEADKARVMRRNCVERGRVYDFETGQCPEK